MLAPVFAFAPNAEVVCTHSAEGRFVVPVLSLKIVTFGAEYNAYRFALVLSN